MKPISYDISFLAVMLLTSVLCFGQNLVPNCDFTLYDHCPSNHSQFDFSTYWYTPGEGSSDLCHACGGGPPGVPGNQWGWQETHSGSGYGHIICYYTFQGTDYREYMQVQLACPLSEGESYTVSFYATCSDNSRYAIDGLGLQFSNQPLDQSGESAIYLNGERPDISLSEGQVLKDKNNWIQIKGSYTAEGGEEYITIGNFLKDNELSVHAFSGNTSRYSSYYIDIVSVVPDEPWIILRPDTTLCYGESIVVDARLACSSSYHWSDGFIGATREIFEPGTYTLDLSVGCGVLTDAFTLSWYEDIETLLPADTFICSEGDIVLDAGSGFTEYLWKDGSIGQKSDIFTEGIYWVEVTDSLGCFKRDSVMVEALSNPIVLLGPDSCICIGDSIELYAGLPDPYTSYLWNDNSTENSLTVLDESIYWVNVLNPCGSASDTVDICLLNCEPLLWVPNAFSPNNDGKNDTFKPRGENITNFRMQVFNRWGELIFTSYALNLGWNGMYEGENCPVGSYVYLINYESIATEPQVIDNMKGIVLLLR